MLTAALITAQPIVLLVFREPIRRRIHQEAVHAEIIACENQYARLKVLGGIPEAWGRIFTPRELIAPLALPCRA